MKLSIDGMHCQACVQRVRKALEKVPNAEIEQVDVGSATVRVDVAAEAAVLEAVRKAGYEPHQTG
jgi:copper chaperone